MGERIDETRVRHIARLSRLDLSDGEVQLFARQLARVLEYAEQIEQVDTTGVEPLIHPHNPTNVLRPDEPGPTLHQDDALSGAPETAQGQFIVPRILAENDAPASERP